MGETSQGFQQITLERAGGVAILQIVRPKALNALDPDTLREIARALREVRRDATVRALIVTGAGEKAFSAGADIGAMIAMTGEEGHAYSRLGHEVLGRLGEMPIPAIAAVNGLALGGGLELALACDLIVAAETAKLGLPEITLGLIPGFGGTQRLPLRTGLSRARELIYSGRSVGAEEALRIGLVDRVVPAAELATEASALATALAAKSPVAMRQAKRATGAAAAALAEGLRYEVEAFAFTFASDDRVEGLTALREKRPPVWKGR